MIVRFLLVVTALAALRAPVAVDDHFLWQSYGTFEFQQELDKGAQRKLSFTRTPTELRIDYERHGQDTMRSAVFITGAGLFYRGFEQTDCAPDTMEYLGLEGEFVLFVLSQAVEGAPETVTDRERVKLRTARHPIELRYLQGLATLRKSVKATGTVDRDGERVTFDLKIDGKRAVGSWSSSVTEAVVADDESLAQWERCWRGVHSYTEDGQSSFTPFLSGKGGMSTFGEVRRAVREQRHLEQGS